VWGGEQRGNVTLWKMGGGDLSDIERETGGKKSRMEFMFVPPPEGENSTQRDLEEMSGKLHPNMESGFGRGKRMGPEGETELSEWGV